MNWIERTVLWTLVLALGISIFTITGCQVPLRNTVEIGHASD